jgi:uncharacterized protein (TIGR02266 family)
MGNEQRRHSRTALDVDFRGRESQGAGQLLFQGTDLSPGGTFLRSDLLLEQGETLAVEFRVPGVPRLMRAQAKVAWVRRFPREPEVAGMGVEFVAMTDEDRTTLSEYLTQVGGART